jgi:prolyl-tRNA synthetase
MGIPVKIIVGRKYLQKNIIEIEERCTSVKTELEFSDILNYFKKDI